MDQAMKTAVEANRKAIMALIESSGPQDFRQIKRECEAQAFGDNQSIRDALEVLVKQGALFEENEDGVTVWDLPDVPWGEAA